MNDDNYELSARDYLLKSAEGEKFEYETLHMAGYDDGPFGDERYVGLPRLNLDSYNEMVAIEKELGLPNFVFDKFGPNFRPLKLIFEDNEDNPLTYETSYTWSNMLLVATPRDPRGPFTVSVYQDWSLVGWLGGPDSEAFAVHLVEKFDFGCAVVRYDALDLVEGQTVLFYPLAHELDFKDAMRLPNRITSPELEAPEDLTWDYTPNYEFLSRNISWDGPGELLVTVDNPEFIKQIEDSSESILIDDEDIRLVPDVWEPGSTAVFVYIDDELVGRIADPVVEARFHDHFTRYDHTIGEARQGHLFQDDKDSLPYFSLDADLRGVLRISWEVVADEVH
jgi:hypothetical protein